MAFVRIGQKVRFDPFIDLGLCNGSKDLRCTVTGIITEVHTEHRWFSVEYGEPKLHTSYHFSEIGDRVILLG